MAAETFEMQRGALMGPRCDHCPGSEADCARNYPCCSDCSHFAEPEQPLDLTPDAPIRPRQEPTMTMPTTLNRDQLGETLARARQINDTKIRRAVERVDQAHAALRDLLRDHAGKADARREVERLEAQLAAAKAKLRGGSRPVAASTGAGTHPCRIDGCDRTFDSGQGRALHERRAHESAA